MKAVSKALIDLVASHGEDIISQPQRLKAMLADLLPHEKRMRYLLEVSMRAEIHKKLTDIQQFEKEVRETKSNALKHYFKEEFFLEDNAVKSVFDCWMEVIMKNDSECDTVFDIDGNVYNTVQIGNQKWMAENLKTTRYQNGDFIETTIPSKKDFSKENKPKYQWGYDWDERNVIKFGRLYTWYAVTDFRNIAPAGWRVPSDNDWNILFRFLITNNYNFDGSSWCNGLCSNKVAKALASKIEWNTLDCRNQSDVGNDLSLNNKTGFSALPGGMMCADFNRFISIGDSGIWWSSSERSEVPCQGWGRRIMNMSSEFQRVQGDKSDGQSVRCVLNI